MCFMDWRIGRVIRAVASDVITSGSAFQIVGQNYNRVGLTIGNAEQIAGVTVRPDSVTDVLVGLDPSLGGPLHITLATHGDLPTHAWWGIDNSLTPGKGLLVIEYICPEEFLAIGLREFQGQYGAK